MRKNLIILTLVFIVCITPSLYAKKIFVLYGFKIGQKISLAAKFFGQPFKTHTFEDGFSYKAFKLKDHFVVFESDNTRPDLIWAIQIQGESNPPWHGLKGINLGDSISKVIKTFGKADYIRNAIDGQTKKEMKNIKYYSYDKSRNFSIEATNKKVTSIKISYNGPNSTKNKTVNFKKFLSDVHSKDLNKISHHIYSDFEYYNKKKYQINSSIIDTLQNSKQIKDIFFNPVYGIITVKDNDFNSAMRVQSEPSSVGYVFKVMKKNVQYEMFFFESYDGWVLKYIDMMK